MSVIANLFLVFSSPSSPRPIYSLNIYIFTQLHVATFGIMVLPILFPESNCDSIASVTRCQSRGYTITVTRCDGKIPYLFFGR